MNREIPDNEYVTIIRPNTGWRLINFKEIREYRDLFFFIVWRNIKVLYAQTILGLSWAILQPTIQIIIFTLVFGKVAKVSSEGYPYVLFSTVAIIPWTYISQAMTQSSISLVSNQNMLGKIYFPRLIFPLSPVFSCLLDFLLSLIVLLCVAFYYRLQPTWNLLMVPFLILYMMLIPAGIGMWLSAMAIRFRDVKHAMPFLIRMLIYTAPIVYSASEIPDKYRIFYSFNPLVGVIEGFRWSILGSPVEWTYIVPGIVVGMLLLLSGAMYFRRMERIFVDVI